jgi:multiple sugar transport system substrate-binding protein
MINGSPALIPIIKEGKVLADSDWTSVPIAGKTGPLTSTLGVCDFTQAFKNGGGAKQAAIKKFLDFAYADKYQVQFDKEYSLLPATTSGVDALTSDQTFAPFLKALPNAVQYPSDTAWTNVKAKIQQTIGTAVTGNPHSVLDDIQAVAKKAS